MRYSSLAVCTILISCGNSLPRLETKIHRSIVRRVIPNEVNLAAGMLAGAIGVGTAYPLDTIKVQSRDNISSFSKVA